MTSVDQPDSTNPGGLNEPLPVSPETVRFFHEDFPNKETILEVLGKLARNLRSARGDLTEGGGTVNHYRQLLELGLLEGLHRRDLSLSYDFAEMGQLLKRMVLNPEIDRPDLRGLVRLFGRNIVITVAAQSESDTIDFQLTTCDQHRPIVDVSVSGETLYNLLEDGHWEFVERPTPPAFHATQHP